ncbi:MAG: VWA domain-containing protein [Nocardioidaceae bacterium]|nr:VWA domain-containing protein [Nocardioidaceae bacterium]
MTSLERPPQHTRRPPHGSVKHSAEEVLAAFAVAVRAAGVPVTVDRSQAFLRAAATVGADNQVAVFWAGRATLCSSQDDLDRYAHVFAAWFSGDSPRHGEPSESPRRISQADLAEDEGGEGDAAAEEAALRVAASSTEVLRHRDVAELDAAERAALGALFETLRPRAPRRLSARRRPARRGAVDARRTMREQLRRGGEPVTLEFRRRTTRCRRVVVLVDVSGSMSPYADSLLRWAHTMSSVNKQGTEVFTVGTRLTRVTAAMRLREGDAAVSAAGQAVPDWSGGTRLGESLQVFLDRWGQRGVARGAVVVIMSDGWERGDSSLLGEQMQRLARLAHRVVWVNPHVGKAGYAPVQSGIVAALPFVDDLVAGHTLATFERVLEVIADA